MRLPQFLAVHQTNYSHTKRTAMVVECRAGFVRVKQKRGLAFAIVYLVEVPRSAVAAGRVRTIDSKGARKGRRTRPRAFK
jgi:hypothetical protein